MSGQDEQQKRTERMGAYTNLAVCGLMLVGVWMAAPILLIGGSVAGSDWMLPVSDSLDDVPWFKVAGIGGLFPLAWEVTKRIPRKLILSKSDLDAGEWYHEHGKLVDSNRQDLAREDDVPQHQQDTAQQDSRGDRQRQERIPTLQNVVVMPTQSAEGRIRTNSGGPKKRRKFQRV